MKNRAYTALGILTWEGIKIVLSRKVGQNRVKLGAAATVVAVLVAGLAVAKATNGDEDS